MKVYEVYVDLYEGGPVSLGLYQHRADAERALGEAKEEWDGPNVYMLDIATHEVK